MLRFNLFVVLLGVFLIGCSQLRQGDVGTLTFQPSTIPQRVVAMPQGQLDVVREVEFLREISAEHHPTQKPNQLNRLSQVKVRPPAPISTETNLNIAGSIFFTMTTEKTCDEFGSYEPAYTFHRMYMDTSGEWVEEILHDDFYRPYLYLSPDHTKLAVVTMVDYYDGTSCHHEIRPQMYTVWLYDLVEETLQELTSLAGFYQNGYLVWSDDSRVVYRISGGYRTIQAYDLKAKRLRNIAYLPDDYAVNGVVSVSVNNQVAVGGSKLDDEGKADEHFVFLIDGNAESNIPIRELRFPSFSVGMAWFHFTWSPDGKLLAFNAPFETPELQVVNQMGEIVHSVVTDTSWFYHLAWSPNSESIIFNADVEENYIGLFAWTIDDPNVRFIVRGGLLAKCVHVGCQKHSVNWSGDGDSIIVPSIEPTDSGRRGVREVSVADGGVGFFGRKYSPLGRVYAWNNAQQQALVIAFRGRNQLAILDMTTDELVLVRENISSGHVPDIIWAFQHEN